jgi:hypothetical protein
MGFTGCLAAAARASIRGRSTLGFTSTMAAAARVLGNCPLDFTLRLAENIRIGKRRRRGNRSMGFSVHLAAAALAPDQLVGSVRIGKRRRRGNAPLGFTTTLAAAAPTLNHFVLGFRIYVAEGVRRFTEHEANS